MGAADSATAAGRQADSQSQHGRHSTKEKRKQPQQAPHTNSCCHQPDHLQYVAVSLYLCTHTVCLPRTTPTTNPRKPQLALISPLLPAGISSCLYSSGVTGQGGPWFWSLLASTGYTMVSSSPPGASSLLQVLAQSCRMSECASVVCECVCECGKEG